MGKVEKLTMCRICLVENVHMCVVTNKSLQEMYEKLADVAFVTEDRKPLLTCFFCCTRLKQCCQLQRNCVEAKEVLAQMLNEGCEKPLTNRGHSEFVGRYITTPIETISIVDDCQIGSDAIKQEPPAVCEEQVEVELQLPHLSEEHEPENLYNSHPDVEAHYSESESEEDKLVMEIKIEKDELFEDLRVREMESDSDDDCIFQDNSQPLFTEVQNENEFKGNAYSDNSNGADVAKKPILKRLLEEPIPAKRTMNVSDTKIFRTCQPSTTVTVDKIKDSVTTTSQSGSEINFTQSSNSILQTRMYTDEKPFKCDVCQRSFSRKSNLYVHFRNHSGEKPFKCDVCQRSFTQSRLLKQHVQIHTGVKPYKCDVCQRSFSQKSNLDVHFRSHAAEKPFKCDFCRRSFTQSRLLKQHIRIHTDERPYKCHVCERSFVYENSLNKHLRQNHPGEKTFKSDVQSASKVDEHI